MYFLHYDLLEEKVYILLLVSLVIVVNASEVKRVDDGKKIRDIDSRG